MWQKNRAFIAHCPLILFTFYNLQYVAKDTEAQIVNTTGLFLILFAIGVTFLLSKFSKDQKPGVASK